MIKPLPLYEKKKTPADTWRILENMVGAKSSSKAPGWALKTLSKQEYRAALIIDGVLYRPLCAVKHPRHQFNYVTDYDTAHAIEKAWNTFTRPAADRVEVETVIYSSLNNKANRR